MRALLVAAALAFCAAASPAAAQSSAAGEAPTRPVEEIAAFAKQVERSLAQRGARVALVGRLARDPASLPPGLGYTHVAYWVYAQMQAADGSRFPGYAVYNLYQQAGAADRSELKQDLPIEFFAAVHELKAGVVVPTPEVQARLLETIGSERYGRLHNPRYSVLANPHAAKFQNCTSFVLDVLLASIYRIDDPAAVRGAARAYFEPQTVRLSPLQSLFGPIFVREVALSDHDGEVRTATFESIAAFMRKYGLAQEEFEATPP